MQQHRESPYFKTYATTPWVTILQNRRNNTVSHHTSKQMQEEDYFCYLNIYFLFNCKVRSFITWNEINKNETNGACTTHIMDTKCWNNLVVKLECNTLVRIFRCRLESNIRMNLNE
jgi:hypothetical protein